MSWPAATVVCVFVLAYLGAMVGIAWSGGC